MANSWFQFKQFIVHQDKCAMKVTTDGCLFGAYVSQGVKSLETVSGKILDIGAGTGLLTLMIAQENEVVIDAIEIDKEAFEQAAKNVAASPWAYRIKVINADAEKFGFPTQYDVIISNPPFYENELKSNDAKKNIAHHNEGLLLPELLQVIKKKLKPDGTFYLLLPYKRNDEIKKLFNENKLSIRQLVLVRQSVNHDYFRIILAGRLKAAEQTETMIEEISIKDDADRYTPAFIDLLKEYYLHL